MKKILVIGAGGREHALGWKIAQSKQVEKVYFAPGNGGTAQIGENINLSTHPEILEFVRSHQIDFVVIGPEKPLVDGLADALRKENIPVFGPSSAAAQLEASKAFTAEFLKEFNIPQPKSYIANSAQEARSYIEGLNPTSYVIKTSGLAAGKGVILPETVEEAEAAIADIMEEKIFGESGNQVVFQERLKGQELSCFALTDGKNIKLLPFFQDHKQVFDGDKGPNTGGMGAYSPVPFVIEELKQRVIDEILLPTLEGMAERGTPYQGVLYAGLFITEAGDPKIIEYNVRFGDPECQPMLLAIKSDILPVLEATDNGTLAEQTIEISDEATACVVLASGGYPGKYTTGLEIHGLDKDYKNVTVFHAGTKEVDDRIVTSGGRVLNVCATGKDMSDALANAYAAVGKDGINFKDMHFRTDIGQRVL